MSLILSLLTAQGRKLSPEIHHEDKRPACEETPQPVCPPPRSRRDAAENWVYNAAPSQNGRSLSWVSSGSPLVVPTAVAPQSTDREERGSWSMCCTTLFSRARTDVDPAMSAITDFDSRVLKYINNLTTPSNLLWGGPLFRAYLIIPNFLGAHGSRVRLQSCRKVRRITSASSSFITPITAKGDNLFLAGPVFK